MVIPAIAPPERPAFEEATVAATEAVGEVSDARPVDVGKANRDRVPAAEVMAGIGISPVAVASADAVAAPVADEGSSRI